MMRGALGAEGKKVVSRPATWVLVILALLNIGLLNYLVPYVAFRAAEVPAPRQGGELLPSFVMALLPRGFVWGAVNGAAGLGIALAYMLGVFAFGSEYRWATLRTLAVQGPSRLALGGAKLGVVGATTLGLAAAHLVTALAASLVIAGWEGVPVSFPPASVIAAGLGAAWLLLTVWAAFGVLAGLALRGTGLAVGLGLLYLLGIEGAIGRLVPWPEGVARALRAALPGANTSAVAQAFFDLPLPGPGAVPPPALDRSVAVLLGYTAVAVVAALALFLHRDID